MKQTELTEVLRLHRMWLSGKDSGVRADLSGADLRGADLSGADLDFSPWPLWCGSVGVKVDARLAYQLAAHVCAVVCDDPDVQAMQTALLPWAQKSHRATECGLLGGDR